MNAELPGVTSALPAVRVAELLAPDGDVHVPATGSGPLDGLRVAVKDLFDVAGRVTSAGNPTLAVGPVAQEHAAAVSGLLAGGAEVVGKVVTDELAMGMFGVNTHYGTPHNPAAPDRVPGGSSSGSAVAVAAGLADLGLGTDTGGSIRVPGAFCGLVGLRPSHGRISVDGLRPMAPRFDTVGLLARDVSTVRRAFTALAPDQIPDRIPDQQRSADVRERPRRLVLLTDLLALADPAVVARTRTTLQHWARALAVPVVETELVAPGSGLPALREIFWPLMSRELWRTNGAWVSTAQPVLGEGIAERIVAAGEVTDAEVAEAESYRSLLVARLDELLADGGVAVLPTTVAPAPPRTAEHAELMAFRDRNLALVVLASLTGAPQLTLPAGRVHAPVGVSLLGLPGDDEMVLAAAELLVPAEAAPSEAALAEAAPAEAAPAEEAHR